MCKFISFKFCTILLEEAFLFDQWPRKLQKYGKLTSCDIHADNERTVIFQRSFHRWADKRAERLLRKRNIFTCAWKYTIAFYIIALSGKTVWGTYIFDIFPIPVSRTRLYIFLAFQSLRFYSTTVLHNVYRRRLRS